MSDSAVKLPEDAPDELLEAVDENEIEVEGVEDDDEMDEETFRGLVKDAVKDACDYIDDDVAPEREKAWRYYNGAPFGNEEEGRSKVVMTEVRDTVQAMLPSLLRVFCASDNAVEFTPRTEAKVEQAEQATDYVNYVFMSDNPGFRILFDSFKDGLISKVGVYKWWTKSSTRIVEENYSGLEQGVVNVLTQFPGVELLSSSQEEQTGGETDPETGAVSPPTFSIKLRRTITDKRQVVVAIPPEEFIVSRNARCEDTADLIGHRCLKTMSELVELGFDEDEIEEHGVAVDSLGTNQEEVARNPDAELIAPSTPSSDESLTRYLYFEVYVRCDKDGDGVAERRRVCAINENCHILHDEVVEDVKLAVLCPDPEPHQVIGSSIADQVMDLQLIKSNVVRNTLDSLAQSINPRTGVVEGMVNMDDVLNTETGGVIRMTQPGMIQDLSQPFVGQQAMPIIAYLDDVRASRTGISKASQGLDPDVLQSTTKAAVTATMSAAEMRLEMVARIFAETGIKRLFKGLLKEVIQNQDAPRMVKLRGQWVKVDPSQWDPEMDVTINVGLGNGGVATQSQMLMQVIAKQEQILQAYGPNNPICTVKQYRDTMAELLAINGMQGSTKYFKPVTQEDLQRLSQPQPPKPDPAEMLAKVQAGQIQADTKIAQDKAALEAGKAKAEDDLKRDQLDADILLRAWELQLKYGTQLQVEQIFALLQRDRDARKADIEEGKVALQGQHMLEQRQQQAALGQQRLQQQGQLGAQRIQAGNAPPNPQPRPGDQ